ncbi:MAG: hypothetical protein EXR99_06410 [Gemmataceae bacterium]|nr:hypothetical protein [Gemmataceae bacterium]
MSKPVGRNLPISPFRGIVIDLMHFSQKVPVAVAERKFSLGALKAARHMDPARPSWTGIFAKAYGLVCRDYPVLRRSYMGFPWARFYEHPHSVASINIEREDAGENIVLYGYVRAPENRTLAEIDEIIRHHKEDPLEKVRAYTRTRALSRVPKMLRRFIWWYTLNAEGKRRCHNFGTFAISSIGALGAGLLHLLPILSTQLHYGLMDKEGNLDMRLSFDHRVLDGATAARVLNDLEDATTTTILRELGTARRLAA